MNTSAKKQAVATRGLRTASGRKVVATLYRPVRKGPTDWRCTFSITGLGEPLEVTVRGIDGLQALTVAIDGVRFHLERAPEPLIWLDGEPGDFGLPRSLPYGFGVEVERHLSAMVFAEVSRLVERKKKAARRR